LSKAENQLIVRCSMRSWLRPSLASDPTVLCGSLFVMTPRLGTLLFALFATSAVAQDSNRQDIVRGLCQPDGCDEFKILAADRMSTSSEGSLFRTRIQTFHASRSGRQDRGQENGYVYCSPTKPAIMAEKNGKTVAFFLAPFATEEKRESVRQNANFHALYFTMCHSQEAGKAAVRNLSSVAQSLGYRVPLTHSKFAALNRAEDVISGETAPPTTAQMPAAEGSSAARVDVTRTNRLQASDKETDIFAGPRELTKRASNAFDDVSAWMLGVGPE
jgi:hypothetical protein